MTFDHSPDDLAHALDDMRTYWVGAEIDAAYALSLAQSKTSPMTAKIRKRVDIVIARNLERAADRTQELHKWLAAGFAEPQHVRELLSRVANTERAWREMRALLHTTPVVPDHPNPPKAITSANDLPGWLMQLEEWASPEREIIDDLTSAIAENDARSDEALDHVEWSAEDDIEAIDAVLHRAGTWTIDTATHTLLRQASQKARAQLIALKALVHKARPFSTQMKIAQYLADTAAASGEKPN
ncbi:hypothetical protein [Hyphomicrobium sp. DY-1]|uniref:hypothetical protein n=1 Tax=Hyphomicrobium sp. DY-1 TaxID=3075650 RepID=UPI0039C1DEEB